MTELKSQKINDMNFYLLEEIDPQTGLYNSKGIVGSPANVEKFFGDEEIVRRVQIFELGSFEGPIRIINSIEEFMEFQ